MVARRDRIDGGSQRLPTSPVSRSVRRFERQYSRKPVVDRLLELGNVAGLTKESILQEVLPDQRSLLIAAPLVGESIPQMNNTDGRVRCTRRSRYRREGCQPMLAPITPLSHAVERQSITIQHPRQSRSDDFTHHVLKIWEEKFAQQQLLIADALYLLVHDDVIDVIESAAILKQSLMSTAQYFELEIILQQLDRRLVSALDSPQPSGTLYQRLLHVVWAHEVSFSKRFESASPRAGIPRSTTCSPTSRVRLLGPDRLSTSPRNDIDTPSNDASVIQTMSKNMNRHKPAKRSMNQESLFSRLQGDLELSHRTLSGHNSNVALSGKWIQDNCMDELLRHRSSVILQMRKQAAAHHLISIFTSRTSRAIASRFQTWVVHTRALRCEVFVQRFCRLKSALKIMILARQVLRRSFYSRWSRWTSTTNHQRNMEKLAAAVTVQSWMRRLLGRNRALTYVVSHGATVIQAAWRGYHRRRMVRRRKRYAAYSVAACVAQHAFRAYYYRRQFALHMRLHRASRCITRSIRRYCARLRLFRSWCERVARFHSAAVIQLWIRQTLRRIRDTRRLHALTTAAAQTLLRFFRFARFRLHFCSRVQRLIERRHRAAVRLQNVYRAKMARARFYALKDELEAQQRQEILHAMWSNAYATTLQRWWRKRRAHGYEESDGHFGSSSREKVQWGMGRV